MSGVRRRRIDRARSAELLSGRDSATPDPLRSVLSAAGGPPRPHEYAGEEAAVAAFHRERLSPTQAPADPPRSRFRLVKVAGFVLAGLSVGGVAFAANGILPGPPSTPPAPAPTVAPSSSAGVSRSEGIAPERSTSSTPKSEPSAEPPPRPRRTPTPERSSEPKPQPRPTPTRQPRPWPMPTELPIPTEFPVPIPLPTSMPTGMPTSMPTNFPDFPGE